MLAVRLLIALDQAEVVEKLAVTLRKA